MFRKIQALMHLLDPLDLIEVCPKDEYDDYVFVIEQMIKNNRIIEVEEYLKHMYLQQLGLENVDEFKIKEFVYLLEKLI